MRMSDRGALVAALVCSLALEAGAAEFYVAPDPGPGGNGSREHPWSLPFALSQPPEVKPGDTIWLRGGTYSGAFVSYLTGSSVSPVVLRSYPGEFARLDGATTPAVDLPNSILTVQGAYAVYRDFEVTCSTNPNPDGGQQAGRPQGLQIVGPNNKFIDLVVHDTGQGIGFWEGASDSEISGCLSYYNGNSQQDHGIYTQNLNGTKGLFNNIIFRNYGFGIHAYATDGHLNNFDIEGNVSFDNGNLNSSYPYKSNILMGAGGTPATSCTSSPQVAHNPRLINNYTYNPRGAGGREIDLGYTTGSCNPAATGNYLVGDTTLNLGPAFGTITITGNTFYGPVAGFGSSTYPSNTYLSSRPAVTQIFLRPNQYEAGRANLVVYNWANQTTVDVDVSSVLAVGSHFDVRNAQNYFGSPVLSGSYAGGFITLPMSGLTPATPIGQPTPTPTGPEFNVFILRALPEDKKPHPVVPGLMPFEPRPHKSGSG